MLAIQQKLNQFKRNEVWTLDPPPKDDPIIGIKWIFKNKLNKHEDIIKNKARYWLHKGIAKGGDWLQIDICSRS